MTSSLEYKIIFLFRFEDFLFDTMRIFFPAWFFIPIRFVKCHLFPQRIFYFFSIHDFLHAHTKSIGYFVSKIYYIKIWYTNRNQVLYGKFNEYLYPNIYYMNSSTMFKCKVYIICLHHISIFFYIFNFCQIIILFFLFYLLIKAHDFVKILINLPKKWCDGDSYGL